MPEIARIPLREGLRLYWRYLVPVSLLPTVLVIVIRVFSGREITALWIMLLLFYASAHCASIPHRKKNVTYLFWMFSGLLWMLAFIPAILVAMLFGYFLPIR